MKLPLKRQSADDFQTPPEALEPLYPYLKKEWVIWEPATGKGNLAKALREWRDWPHGVIESDILFSQDFLTWQPKREHWDCIITNPPFSLKQQFLERCYALGKPFALLLPLTTFETAKRQKLFRENGVEVIFFPKRINFETPNKVAHSSAWFATAWFTHGLKIGKELTFT